MRTAVAYPNVDGVRPAVAKVAVLPRGWVSHDERLVLMALALDSLDGSRTAPGWDELAARVGIWPSSVREVVRRLESPDPKRNRPVGLIRCEQHTEPNRTTFVLLLP